MKKIYIYTGLILSIVFLTSSCKFKEELRTDPINPLDAPPFALLPPSQVGLAYAMGGNMARFNSYFTQQVAGVDRQGQSITRYIFGQADTDDTWDNHYQYINSLELIVSKTQALSPHYAGVAKVMMAMAYGNLTALFGDIPFSEAAKGNEQGEGLQAKFDSQESVYEGIQSLLDAAIVDLQSPESVSAPGGDDLIYAGDVDKYIKMAYSLKARYYLHLRLKNPATAGIALAQLEAGGFTGNADNAAVGFPGTSATDENPYYQFYVYRYYDMLTNTSVDLLKPGNDPRIPFYTSAADSSELFGIMSGDDESAEGAIVGPFISSPNSSVYLITFPEVKFIEAEAAFVTGDLLRAAEAHNEGVLASVEMVTGEEADSTFTADFASETAGSITLETIMNQKYLAVFLQPEVFTDYRRTGFPVIPPALNNATGGLIPQRWPYPQKEQSFNSANIPQEGTVITNKVWWDE